MKLLLGLVVISVALFAIKTGVEKSEYNECVQLQHDKQEYQLFTAADWQIEQCAQYHISLK